MFTDLDREVTEPYFPSQHTYFFPHPPSMSPSSPESSLNKNRPVRNTEVSFWVQEKAELRLPLQADELAATVDHARAETGGTAPPEVFLELRAQLTTDTPWAPMVCTLWGCLMASEGLC